MSIIAVADIACMLALLVSVSGVLLTKKKNISTKRLTASCCLCFIWLITDIFNHTIPSSIIPAFIFYINSILLYSLGEIILISFMFYCKSIIDEKKHVSPLYFYIPMGFCILSVLILILYFFFGNEIYVENNILYLKERLPVICYIIDICVLIYLLIISVLLLKDYGLKIVSLLGIFAIFPLASMCFTLISGGIDYTIIAVAFSHVLVCDLLQKSIEFNQIDELNYQLQTNQNELKNALIQQQAQIDEITKLNIKLENNKIVLEKEQEQARLRMQTMTEAIHGGFKISKNDKYFTFNYVSEQLAEMLGYTVSEFIKASDGSMAGIVNMEDVKNELPQALASIERGEMYTMNYRIRCKDGGWKNVEDRGRLIKMPGGEDEYWCFIIDKDELILKEEALEAAKKANEELEQTQKKLEIARQQAEYANNEKSSFVLRISHDIRTSMNSILGFIDLMEENHENPEKRTYYLKKVNDSSAILRSILNNVMEMARIEKGSCQIHETACSSIQLMEALHSIFDEMMKTKGIEYKEQINISHPYIYCDLGKVRGVFLNIISNAYKYTEAGGKILFTLEEEPADNKDWIVYKSTISDTGIGMSDEFIPHIFEEFSKEQDSIDYDTDGNGLGMPIVKKLIDFMNGTIEIESKKGEGSKFVVRIPHRIAEKENLVDLTGIDIDSKNFKGKRVLVVEDSDLNAEIICTLLQEMSLEVDRAIDGSDCIDKILAANDNYYDLILMDIQMPNMNGYEATRRIRLLNNQKKSEIPILALTAYAFEENRREAYSSGMNGHLSKPINKNELLKQLSIILG